LTVVERTDAERAVAAAAATANSLGLAADDDRSEVLSDSNRMVVRLLPCDVVARVASKDHFADADQELVVAHHLAATRAPIASPDPRTEPRVHERDGFEITFWEHLQPTSGSPTPTAYAEALVRLHAGLRRVDVPSSSRFSDRLAAVVRAAADQDATPDLADGDRDLLVGRLHQLARAVEAHAVPEQLLHGEPHQGNVVLTAAGPRFVDFENATRGPVEYDLAWVPDDVARRYPGVDHALVDQCRGLVHAIIATHRWTAGDEHPSGRASGVAFLAALAGGPPWPAIDEVRW
jgi:hypothetical protein